LGGGAELTLACHHRILLDRPGIQIGFPEVTLGLLPGGGGVVRTIRLVGVIPALQELLLDGKKVSPAKALELGLVDELATDEQDLLEQARTFIRSNPTSAARWDVKGFTFPGGDGRAPAVRAAIGDLSASLRKKLKNSPFIAPHHIFCVAVEGSVVDLDTALAIETRYYVDLATSQVSSNMIQGSFLDRQAVARGGRSAEGGRTAVARVGVVGAGIMGSGIAHACALAGLDVILTDTDAEAAQRGHARIATSLDQQVARGAMTTDEAAAVLGRITAAGDIATLADREVVIEAVFEDTELKRSIFKQIEATVGPDALIASNTSTLPITELAEGLADPARFLGLHFFSPVPRMDLVEVIRGGQTTDETLARAMDFVLQIRKSPIVVKDSRGFFTSRVFGKFTREGVAMLAERVPASSINQASQRAGYPVPVLQLMDELSLTLPKKIRDEAIAAAAAAGQEWVSHPSEPVYDAMVDTYGRPGRAGGAGFYEYSDGKRTRLWPGLEEAFGPTDPDAVPFEDLVERLLFSEAVEALRCLDEGVIGSAAEANVGSLLGIGYPGWTGGVVQYVNGYPGGPAGFLARAEELTARYGARFSPPQLLRDKVAAGELIA
jgi:3-hydroxyacyl-CoA dehydrogenase/enoyl-CoA hydratase/3-hydroxybutyryl-CoA epimerase